MDVVAVVSQPKPYLHPAKTIFRRSCTVDPPHNISPLFAKVGHPFSADKILRFKEFATGARDRGQELLIESSAHSPERKHDTGLTLDTGFPVSVSGYM